MNKFVPLKAYGRIVCVDELGLTVDGLVADCSPGEAANATGREYARLFAAAPEMYALLHKQADFTDEGGSAHLARTGRYSLFDEPGAVQAARELLAKIEGEQP